tara:strand:- start:1915 stop:2808 length:894 start_codon:yes stop_codon:yes gene_type:complete
VNHYLTQERKAYFFAACAYSLWGVLPIYWKLMEPASSTEVLSHRMVWSLAVCMVLVPLMGQGQQLCKVVQDRSALLRLAASGSLVGLNWLTYIWAVQNEYIIETSLGYFLCPLLTVAFGIVVLGERLGWRGWTAILLACCGVFWPLLKLGYFPWIALTLASTFSIYSLVRKTVRAQSLVGLSVETSFMFLPAVCYLLWLASTEQLVFLNFDWQIDLLLIGAGLMTSIPLLLFASAAKVLPLSSIGLMQYIAPLLQLSCGVLIYSETFTQSHRWTFGWIWFALIFYSWELTCSEKNRD